MAKQLSTAEAYRISRVFKRITVGTLLIGVLLVLLAGLIPIKSHPSLIDEGRNNRRNESIPHGQPELSPLMHQMAGRRLIKPAQIKAAIKDTGVAGRLAKKLKLQGIVQMGGKAVAYVKVEKQGVKSVRQGDKLLEFLVEKIEPGRVILDLDGIQIQLQN